MSNVNSYVNVMRKQGQMRATVNPNSEMSMLKQELIEHYKHNKAKAQALIDGIENNNFVNVSPEQRMHYDAAVIAVRGYNSVIPQPSLPVPRQVNELDTLKKAGWEELNKSKAAILLHERM